VARFDEIIPPGSEGKVYASVDIAHSKGQIQKQIQLTTNDPQRTDAVLYIKGVIKSYVDVKPNDQVRFTVRKGETESQNLTLVPESGRQVQFGDPIVDSKYLEVTKQQGDSYMITVALKPDTPIGTQKAVITVPAESLPSKKVEIPVIAVVRGPITVLPAVVSFNIRTYPEQVATKTAESEVLQDANVSSVAIDTVKPDAPLRVIEQKDDWYHVITPANKIGWIQKSE